MKRKSFLQQSAIFSAGSLLMLNGNVFSKTIANTLMEVSKDDLYRLFKNPTANYRPFVRWWWNGNKIEKSELTRELKILKDAGIGGVEINPISFPSNTDDMGIPSVEWLSDEWIDLLKFALEEAKRLDMTCDLLAGTGFPFGAEFLEGEERAQVVVTAVKKLEGPIKTEISVFDIFKEADPATLSPYSGRKMELLELKLVPDPLINMDQIINIKSKVIDDVLKIDLPKGKFGVYALVKIDGFMKVIQGAPGGRGPVLNHYNEAAVNKYLNRITDSIQGRIGPLAPSVRSFFIDSLEMEGANWNSDMMAEFQKRRGYDLYPFLPFILFKTGRMGNTVDLNYAVDISPEMEKMLNRMRYDFEYTKAELFRERFSNNFIKWCKENKIKSRAQA
ncbi:MAG: glycoside hydrolase family 2, partial [Pedobacter sp.]|nr:glycoside hydrolase family 2 [Pedobacter sp.]